MPLAGVGLIVIGLLFAAFGGVATALMGPLATFVLTGLVVGTVALMLPLPWLVVALLALSFLITGQLIYFARVEKAMWFPFLLGVVLLMRFPLDYMLRAPTHRVRDSRGSALGASLSAFIGLYFLALFASTLINVSPPMQILVSAREYLFLWGLYLLVAAGLVRSELVVRLWALLPWLIVIQLPLVIYQRFVVMPGRASQEASWDAVVGAFGGDPSGGGSSGAMGMFCVVGMVTAAARWRNGLMPGWQTLVLIFGGLLCIALAEVKFVVLLLPVAFGLLFVRELRRRPVQSLLAVTFGIVASAGLIYLYKFQFEPYSKSTATASEYLDSIVERNADTEMINMRTGEIGRVAAIVFWYRQHDIRDPTPLLLGHGAGSSRRGGLVVGEVQQHYMFNLTRNAVSVLLWEVGLVGTAALIGLLVSGYLLLLRQSLDPSGTAETRATLASMAVAVAVFLASILYDKSLISGHQTIIMLMLCLGYAKVVDANPRTGDAVPASKRRLASVARRHL